MADIFTPSVWPQEPSDENIHRLRSNVEQLWLDFVSAKVRCERSMLFSDGVECGRAFRRFLREFSELEAAEGNVINLAERRP